MAIPVVRSSALGAFFVAAALALGACGGDDVPSDAVATVGGEPVTKTEFAHWMNVANLSQQQSAGVAKPVAVPDAPDYKACVAATRAATKPVKGQPTPTDAQLKTQCKTRYDAMRSQVMNFLISADWIDGEAADQSVVISGAAVDKEFAKRKKESFKTEAAYTKFLKDSGLSLADLKFQVRLDLLRAKLQEKIVGGTDKVTPKAVADYYRENKSKFASPERRDIRIVLTKSEASAKAAKAALARGDGWPTVAKRYSTDQATKNAGGVLLAVTKGSQEQALDAAVFGADRGKLLGPIKTQFGNYVFQVTKITPAAQQTEAQAKPAIEQQLRQQNQDSAVNDFSTDFQKKWTEKTTCREEFAIELCENAPKTTATTAPGTTAPATTTPATTTG